MQRLWSAEELRERWTLGAEDLALLASLPDAGKLGLAAQLAYWRQNGRFPDEEADLAPAVTWPPEGGSISGPTGSRSTASSAPSGGISGWRTHRAAGSGSIASTTRLACCRPC